MNVVRIQLARYRFGFIAMALWVLTMIAIPILRWTLGDSFLPMAVSASVLLQAAASVLVLGTAWGIRRTAVIMATILPVSWLVERIGSSTGIPFGHYDYTTVLQPQLLGVPLLIPVAWLMMLPAAWAVAELLTRRRSLLLFIAVSALAFTVWDLFLDPQMVAWHYWEWATPRGYFGIPWSNYAGWLLSSALLTAAVYLPPWRPGCAPAFPLLVIYSVTWALQWVGLALFWGMPGPAAVGFLSMGLFVALSWRAWSIQRDPSGNVTGACESGRLPS